MNAKNKNTNMGRAIKQALSYAGLSRVEACHRMGMSQARLNELQEGSGELRFYEAVKLLMLTGVTYEEFVAMTLTEKQ